LTISPQFLALVFLCPALACAAHPPLLDLVMPGASRIAASPIGSAMALAMHKGLWTQAQAQSMKADLAGIEWTQDVQQVVVAGAGTGKDSAVLVLLGGLRPAARMQLHTSFSAKAVEFEGVPVMSTGGTGDSAIALLDDSTAALGRAADVRAAIHRRHQGARLPAALAARIGECSGQYDAWICSIGALPVMAKVPGADSQAVQMMEWARRVESFAAGLRVSRDLELTAEVGLRTEKDAASAAQALNWFAGMMASPKAGNNKSGLEDVKFQVSGKRISLSARVPEKELLLAMEQQTRSHAAVPRLAKPAAPSPPPPGMIRVQSSPKDMGTVLLPTGESH
jgi:hypothetical protein